MPLYEFECEACGERVEKIQKYSAPPPESCAICGGPMKKLPSSPAIQFKGSGFYITDYPKKSSSDASKAGNTSGKTSESNASDSKESKKESKKESSTSSDAPTAPATKTESKKD